MAVSILQLVGLGVLGLGVILHIVGTATPGWVTVAHFDDEFESEVGLFKTCINTGCSQHFDDIWISTVKALTLTGVALSLLAGLLAVVAIVLRKRNPNPSNMPSVFCLFLCLLAGLLIFIGVIIFGVMVFFDAHSKSNVKFGYSFGLCITGGILIILGGAMISAVCLEKPNNNQTIGTTVIVQYPPMVYQPQAVDMVYQPQAGLTQQETMVSQNQGGGMPLPSATTKENDANYTPAKMQAPQKGKTDGIRLDGGEAEIPINIQLD